MSAVFRRLFNFLTAISLLLLLICLGLWAYVASGSVVRQEDMKLIKAAQEEVDALEDRRINGEALTPAFMELLLTWHRRLVLAKLDVTRDTDVREALLQQYIKDVQNQIPLIYDPPPGPLSQIQFLQVGYFKQEAERMIVRERRQFWRRPRRLLPWTAVFPILWVMHRIGRRIVLRTKPGVCANCGYDLRATPERCPECGTVAEIRL